MSDYEYSDYVMFIARYKTAENYKTVNRSPEEDRA